jgi:hypothetical protein
LLKLSNERARFESGKADNSDEEDDEQAEKIQTLTNLRIFKAIDYVLIARDLIIDKMNALRDLLNQNKKVTYEEVIEHLNRVLKAKSTVAGVADIKKMLKNKLLVRILRNKGKIEESKLDKIKGNVNKLHEKFNEVLAPDKIIQEEEVDRAQQEEETRRMTEEMLRKWKEEADKKREDKQKQENDKIDSEKQEFSKNEESKVKERENEFEDSDVD